MPFLETGRSLCTWACFSLKLKGRGDICDSGGKDAVTHIEERDGTSMETNHNSEDASQLGQHHVHCCGSQVRTDRSLWNIGGHEAKTQHTHAQLQRGQTERKNREGQNFIKPVRAPTAPSGGRVSPKTAKRGL